MIIKIFDCLPVEATEIRKTVFCDEQGFKYEFDETDKISVHLVAFENELPIATCRIFNDNGVYHLGRLAVIKSCRGENVGAKLINEAVSYVNQHGGNQIEISAQTRVCEFYVKQGFLPYGETYSDEGCPHIKMIKNL